MKIFYTAAIMFYILQNIMSAKDVHFSKIYYDT